ncbi:hypothetical protein L6452_01063 [Arctium lappa]|uniref:Uncharacterized protein n=1 Tax=Arctium lappa TaxID=4217 RepID=A0ACB9FG96_ARCLA|nr:hypothetical protein L6452_01063 [Arctium lappa]
MSLATWKLMAVFVGVASYESVPLERYISLPQDLDDNTYRLQFTSARKLGEKATYQFEYVDIPTKVVAQKQVDISSSSCEDEDYQLEG